ncbi:Os08g0256100 [Oryza sativa Japonica Group]|uniref:Os08g0256100 protein n=1 Tax=Oryza sativa subsp. japonica TaxID=39947 RepID=A0A0P0XDQ5_ORYSJ|nr:Os08g0256100 [Oryza sativa Japonica Group]
MQGTTTTKVGRNGDHADAGVEGPGTTRATDGRGGATVAARKVGDMRRMSCVEAKDSLTIVALQSLVTVERSVRGDLEEHIPKPCKHKCNAF